MLSRVARWHCKHLGGRLAPENASLRLQENFVRFSPDTAGAARVCPPSGRKAPLWSPSYLPWRCRSFHWSARSRNRLAGRRVNSPGLSVRLLGCNVLMNTKTFEAWRADLAAFSGGSTSAFTDAELRRFHGQGCDAQMVRSLRPASLDRARAIHQVDALYSELSTIRACRSRFDARQDGHRI